MKILLFAVCIMLLLCPAFAQTVTYTASDNDAVWAIYITSPIFTHGTFDIYQANGDTVSGSWSYDGGIPTSGFTATLGSDSDSFNYVVPLSVGMEIWNGDNTSYARELKMGFGQLSSLGIQQGWNRVLVTEIDRAVITGYKITADKDVTVRNELVPRSTAAADLNAESEGPGLVDLLTQYTPLIVSVFLSLMYWLKFIFIDHLILTVSLYFTGTMAYAIFTSRDIFSFYKTWFKQQRAFFEFMSNAFSTTFQIVTQVAAVVGNAVGSLINVALIAARILFRL